MWPHYRRRMQAQSGGAMNLAQIKAALAANMPVHWSNDAYIVSEGLITFKHNQHAIGLTWLDGVTLNGKEAEFFIGDCDELRDFIHGYQTCALWASTDELADGTVLEGLEDYEFSQKTSERMVADCRAFVSENIVDLLEYAERREAECLANGFEPWAGAGHDFWLTRCGHGVGFWDRGLEELGDKLSEAARVCGNLDPYIGDNGEVWI